MPTIKALKKNRWVARQYGSRKGLLQTLWHQLLYRLKHYSQYEQIDWSSANRLVFVCKGNICRSAFAEELARSLGVKTTSFGVDTKDGAPANADAIKMAKQFGYDLSFHKTTNFKSVKLKENDVIIAMEPSQIDVIKEHLIGQYQYSLLGLWAHPVMPHIQDPYGSSSAYFNKCFSYIQLCVQELAREIKS